MKKLGYTFGDNLFKAGNRKIHVSSKIERTDFNTKIFLYFMLLFFVLLTGKSYVLQIIKGAENRNKSNQNRIQIQTINPLRGVIYDSEGTLLAYNKPENHEELLKKLYQNKTTVIDSSREYPYGNITAHLIGYLSENIGASGIENYYDNVLRGKAGRELAETNALGENITTIKREDPIPGENITLNINLKLQKTAALAMDNIKNNARYTGDKIVKGAVVVTDYSGRILVLYSAPSFNPNDITLSLTDTVNMPLVNRAISGTYPPGSTFKIITALAALEENKITGNTLFEDTGVLTIGQWSFPNWLWLKRGQMDGWINIVTAIQRSNDIFFYKTAETTGLENIQKWSKKLSLGKRTGIDLPGEAEGLVPSNSWKKETIGEEWFLGDTYHLGIGQGYLLVTPLQDNIWTLVIANGGKLCKPKLLATNTVTCTDLKLNLKNLDLIRTGMEQACQTNGTGWPFFDYKKAKVLCKTGTAEFGNQLNKTHAWFTAFTKDIIVTVLVEKGGEGSDVSSFVAKEIIDKYYE